MKKSILVAVMVVSAMVFTQPCFSQIAVVLGVTKTSITGSESWKDPIGFQLGAIIPFINLNDMLSLRGEANLSLQGARWEEYDLKGRTNLLYINIPLVIRYKTESGFFGEAGIQPGFLLSAKDKYEGHTDDYMEYMNKFDLGIPLEVGYEFENNFGVGFRVIPGITNISKDSDVKDLNLVFALRGTYTFKLK